jgi:AraC family transcriptional regulator
MPNPTHFKSGQFYGDVQHGTRGGTFDIRRLTATRNEDEVATHRHDDAHFVFVLSGTYISSALYAPARTPAPALVYNPAGTVHRDRFLDGKGRFMTLSLDPAILAGAEETRAAQERAFILTHPAAMAAAFRMAREIGSGGDSAVLEALAWELLAKLDIGAPAANAALPAWAHWAYDAVMDMASDSHLRIADLATELAVHPVHLARVFRKAWDCSPGDMLRWRRVERAIDLLRSKDLCIAEVALASGFADQSHMTCAFQAQCGISPRGYRKRMFQTFKKSLCTPD